jgi:hypothetical protein
MWMIYSYPDPHGSKGIGSILFLKNGLKKVCRKNNKNHFRSNNYEVFTALARCFPNILEVMVLSTGITRSITFSLEMARVYFI